MSERRFSKQEVMDALMAASESVQTGSTSLSESEMYQIADEMGVDRSRLRDILEKGTGTITANDYRTPGLAMPANEEFERIISGELSDDGLRELQGDLGTTIEGSVEERRIVGETWVGWRYVTTEITVREGRTRIVSRSRSSMQRLMPVYMFTGMFAFITLITTLKRAPEFVGYAIAAIVLGAITFWALLSRGLRQNGDAMQASVDRLAKRVQEEVQYGSRGTTRSHSVDADSQDELLRNLSSSS